MACISEAVIVSASYKTDIPAFYGEWFIRRLRAGYCRTVNPYNLQPIRVPLDRKSVDAFVFWTKNVHPFIARLAEVRDRGYPFIVQYTINGYPRALETSVVDRGRSVESAWKVRELFGSLSVVWRYDTIVFTSLTPGEFHLENFARLAEQLAGATNEVVISFAQFYQKTKRNLDIASHEHGFTWFDPTMNEKKALLREMVRIASRHRLRLTICSQPELVGEGSAEARCVDAQRIRDLGASLQARLKGNRKECGCYESRDIGDYDTCPHGCVYCYAVQKRDLALARFKKHDPASEFLFEPASNTPKPAAPRGQTLKLFPDDDDS